MIINQLPAISEAAHGELPSNAGSVARSENSGGSSKILADAPSADTDVNDIDGDEDAEGATDPDGDGDAEQDVEAGNSGSNSHPATTIRGGGLPVDRTAIKAQEAAIKTRQSSLAAIYQRLASQLSRALRLRVTAVLAEMDVAKATGQESALLKEIYEAATKATTSATGYTEPVTRIKREHIYQNELIRNTARGSAGIVWCDFQRQKQDLRHRMLLKRQRTMERVRHEYNRGPLIRATDVPVLDWVSANLDVARNPSGALEPLDDHDAASDLQMLKKPKESPQEVTPVGEPAAVPIPAASLPTMPPPPASLLNSRVPPPLMKRQGIPGGVDVLLSAAEPSAKAESYAPVTMPAPQSFATAIGAHTLANPPQHQNAQDTLPSGYTKPYVPAMEQPAQSSLSNGTRSRRMSDQSGRTHSAAESPKQQSPAHSPSQIMSAQQAASQGQKNAMSFQGFQAFPPHVMSSMHTFQNNPQMYFPGIQFAPGQDGQSMIQFVMPQGFVAPQNSGQQSPDPQSQGQQAQHQAQQQAQQQQMQQAQQQAQQAQQTRQVPSGNPAQPQTNQAQQNQRAYPYMYGQQAMMPWGYDAMMPQIYPQFIPMPQYMYEPRQGS